MAIIMTIAAIAVPNFMAALDQARVARATAEIHAIETDIAAYESQTGLPPDSLADIGDDQLRDPWGNPYQYFNIFDGTGNGTMRLDLFGVPLNDDYDLYSLGKDSQTDPSLAAPQSQDDIVRASDGAYIVVAAQY